MRENLSLILDSLFLVSMLFASIAALCVCGWALRGMFHAEHSRPKR